MMALWLDLRAARAALSAAAGTLVRMMQALGAQLVSDYGLAVVTSPLPRAWRWARAFRVRCLVVRLRRRRLQALLGWQARAAAGATRPMAAVGRRKLLLHQYIAFSQYHGGN